MIRVKIVPNDTEKVAKVVIIRDDGCVLMLKRSDYVEKYAGEWDLPGGHLRVGEDIEAGMRREVKEETNLDVQNCKFVTKIDNLSFYYCMYPEGENAKIQLSHEHTKFKFFTKKELNSGGKFEKVALKALGMKK